MKYDARKITTEEQHLIRKLAVQRVFDGESAAEVTRSFGLGSKTIFAWLKIAREKGIDALAPKARTGRNRMLSPTEEQEVKRWVIGGDPRQHGFDFGLWTRQIVADLIEEKLGIEMSLSGVGKLLGRLGLTPQKPLRRAYERDEAAVKEWIDEVYPKVQKIAKKTGAEIFWLDEASIRSDDPLQSSNEYHQFWSKLNRGEFQSGEYKRVGKHNKEVWIQASYNPILNLNGDPFKVVKYATAITEQKLKNANFEGQIDAIGKAQAVIEFNTDGSIITANDNFLETMGYTLSDIQGQHHRIFVEPSVRESLDYRQFWEKLNRGEYEANEYKRIAKNGDEVWIQASYNPIFDLNGKPYKVVKYATNITGRKVAINKIKEVIIALSNGDLTRRIDDQLEGEFQILADAINSLITNLETMIMEIREASTRVFAASKEIAQGNTDLSQRTETQASSLEETASAMEELTTTVQQNAENSSQATKLANGAMENAGSGGEVVQNTVTAMEEINKSSKKISDIISVID